MYGAVLVFLLLAFLLKSVSSVLIALHYFILCRQSLIKCFTMHHTYVFVLHCYELT